MASAEIDSFRSRLFEEFDRIVKAVDGLDEAAVNWRPSAASANSLLVLGTHTFGAAEEHVLHRLCGETIDRSRPAEFAATGSGAHLHERADEVKRRISTALDAVDTARLDEEHDTPVGKRQMRSWLIHAIAHAAEHAGQAELTRDLYAATKGGAS
jgi:uncharacterized damage-inducible protein DinB